MSDKAEVKGVAETLRHGVTFRLEVASLKSSVMAHMQDQEGALNASIDAAIEAAMNDIGPEIACLVETEVRSQLSSMVRSRVNDAIHDKDFQGMVRDVVKERLAKEFSLKT